MILAQFVVLITRDSKYIRFSKNSYKNINTTRFLSHLGNNFDWQILIKSFL